MGVLKPGGTALIMVKPQFEVGRRLLGPGGVVRDESERLATVDAVSATASELGWHEDWRGVSRLPARPGTSSTSFACAVRTHPAGAQQATSVCP